VRCARRRSGGARTNGGSRRRCPRRAVAPILGAGVREREVYFPAGADWRDVVTGETHAGGSRVSVPAPPHRIPALARAGAPDTGAAWSELR
jgi:hypothetical protein